MPLTEVDDLIARLERDPENDILAAMLCDELMDARGMYKFEAMSKVRQLQDSARAALDIAYIAKVIRAAGPLYTYLTERVRRGLGQPVGSAYVMFLVDGDARPRIGVSVSDLAADDPGPGIYVTLPCSWARKQLANSALPLHWPKSPARVRKLMNQVRPKYRIAFRCADWSKV